MHLAVADTGPGIPDEVLERIFDRYVRADASADKGRGLGLAIAKGIVESQGGRLWAESQNGAGATFVIELPEAGASSA